MPGAVSVSVRRERTIVRSNDTFRDNGPASIVHVWLKFHVAPVECSKNRGFHPSHRSKPASLSGSTVFRSFWRYGSGPGASCMRMLSTASSIFAIDFSPLNTLLQLNVSGSNALAIAFASSAEAVHSDPSCVRSKLQKARRANSHAGKPLIFPSGLHFDTMDAMAGPLTVLDHSRRFSTRDLSDSFSDASFRSPGDVRGFTVVI